MIMKQRRFVTLAAVVCGMIVLAGGVVARLAVLMAASIENSGALPIAELRAPALPVSAALATAPQPPATGNAAVVSDGAATATATLVASRAANPGPAVVLAAVFNLAGPFLLGTAVAATIGALVVLAGRPLIAVIGAGTSGAVLWTAVTWRLAIPSSSSASTSGSWRRSQSSLGAVKPGSARLPVSSISRSRSRRTRGSPPVIRSFSTPSETNVSAIRAISSFSLGLNFIVQEPSG